MNVFILYDLCIVYVFIFLLECIVIELFGDCVSLYSFFVVDFNYFFVARLLNILLIDGEILVVWVKL